MFLLDTDHVGIIQRLTEPAYNRLAARMAGHPPQIHLRFGHRDFTVLTRNTADFRKVPGLKVEDWTL